MNKRLTITLVLAACSVVLSAQSVSIANYYSAANGKKQAELKTALYHIIGSPNVMSYGSLWSGYYETDRADDNQVIDRYSYKKYYFSGKSTTAVSGMNKEHGVPNSWWGHTKNAAYSDLHHLMPSDSEANNRKGNFGMGVVTSTTYNNGCIKVGKGSGGNNGTIQLWEPADEWKGDFARAYFYVATAYEELSMVQSEGANSMQANTYPKLQPWCTQLYRQWNKQDPVDDLERKRNEAVYAIQGNRNPFVDYPTLAEYIWGDSTTVAFDVTKPHTWDGSGQTPELSDSTVILESDFTQGYANFEAYTISGQSSSVWTQSSAYGMMANAYSKGKTADDWLLSPVIDLTGMTGAVLQFEHATGYNATSDASEMMEVLITADVTTLVPSAGQTSVQWSPLTVHWPAQRSSSFTAFESSGKVSLDSYAGQRVRIAFRYRATDAKCWAWEIKHLSLRGKPSTIPVGIAAAVMPAVPQAVFDLQGRPLGNRLPQRSGTYIVVSGNGVMKVYK